MKNEILCPDCSEELKRIIGKGHPGEYTEHKTGRALQSFCCDFCGKEIKPLDMCVAYSVWTDTIPLIANWHKGLMITEGG